MPWTRRTLLGTTAAIGLSGCLGGNEQGDATTSPPESGADAEGDHDDHGDHEHDIDVPDAPVGEVDVDMLSDEGHHFEPHLVWIEAGGTVTWTVESGAHTTTAYHRDADRPSRIPENGDGWDSGTLGGGQAFERTFDDGGVYDYFCVPHEGAGMVGTVIVGDPDPHEQPGLEPPQDDLPDDARTVLEGLNDAANRALGHTHD